MANTKWSEFAPSEAVSAIGRVAGEFGIDPAYLMGLAKLETRVGSKSIRNGDDDTRNLFNIKDFSGGGIRAVDKAEGSNDAYRQYASYDESARDLVSLLERKFPAALEAKNPAEFAAALKKGGYATDPDYAGKLASVIEGASGAVKPAVNWDDFKPTGEAAGTDVNWDDFKPVAEQPVKPPEKPGAISSAIDSIGSGMNAVRDFATGAKPKRSSVLEGMQVPDLPFDAQEAERLSSRAYAERTPIPGAPKRVFPTMRPSTGPDRISTATSLGESVQDMPSLVRALAKAGSGILQGVGGVARAVGDVTGLDSLARGGALTAKQGGEFEKALGETGPIEGFGPKSPAPYLVDMAEGAASSLAQSAALATAFGPGAVIPLMSVQTAGQEYDKARTQGLDPAMALAGAIPKGIFEAVGEKFTGLDKVAGAMGTLLQKGASDAAKRTAGEVLIRSGIREIPGEVITYLGQTGTDLIPGIGLKQDLTMREFVDGLRDTVVQAGMMGGAMAGGGHAVHTKAPAATPSAQDLTGKHWGDGFTAQPKPDPIATISSAATVDEAIVAATAAVESQPTLAGGQPTPAPAATVNPEIEQLNQRIAELENLNARQTTAPVEPTPDAIPAPAPASTEQLPGPNGAQSGQTDPAQPGQAALNEQAPPQAASEAGPAPAPAAGRVEATVPATTRAEAGAGELEAAGLTTPQRPPASWVIREKATGTVIMETFDPKKVQALNTQKYEAVPITEHLSGMSQRDALPVTTLKADGTLSIQGDPATIKAKLTEAGLTGIRTRDGMQVGKSQASKAQSIFQQETPISQSVQAVTAIKYVAQTGPQQIGRDNRPLTEGGKPFKTRLAAAEAKKLQPMMRVVSVEGGFALADKTPKQLAAEQKAARRLRNPQTSAPGEPIPAHAFIAAEGGLHADTKPDMNVGGNPRIGNRMLFGGAGKGLSMERATARLIEEGYLDEGASHSQAMALIKRSLTQPQYNADGYERIAEAESQARFDDYLAAEQEEPSPEILDEDAAFLALRGYIEPTAEEWAEINALVHSAEADGIDTEIALLHAGQAEEQTNNQDYANDHAEIEASEYQPAGGQRRAEAEVGRAEPGRQAAESAGDRNGQPADRQEGAGEVAPGEIAPTAELTHNGTRIYPVKMAGQDGTAPTERWAVESKDNKQRRESGDRNRGGDSLHVTVEDAKQAADFEAKRDDEESSRKAELAAQEKAGQEALQAKRDANKGKSLTEIKAQIFMAQEIRDGGQAMTRSAWVDRLVGAGESPSVQMVDKIKPLSRAAYNRASNQEQHTHEQKIKSSGQVAEYSIGDYIVSKTEYDYAKKLSDSAIAQDHATQATAILDAAKVTGKERIDVLKDIKRGDVTPEELQAAYPAKVEGLTAPSKQDILDQQQRAEAAAKSEKAQQRAADELARRERERKDIAKASEAAADTFTLGGDAEQNLSGQGGMFDEAAPAPAAKAGAKPTSDNPTRPIKTGDVLRKNGHDYTVVEVWGNLVDAERVIEKGNGLTRKEGIALTAVEAMEAREAGNAAMGRDRAADVGAASGRQGMFDAPEPKPERKIQQTDTPAFREWFGDSKAVDANGKPLVMYHGTGADISVFDKDGLGAHFTSDKTLASDFANSHPSGSVLPVYLSIANPLRIEDHGGLHSDATSTAEALIKAGALPKSFLSEDFYSRLMSGDRKNKNWYAESNAKELTSIRKILQSKGYDGIVYENTGERGGDAFIPFEPAQIKSAIGNNGQFDASNDDIRFSRDATKEIRNLVTLHNLSEENLIHAEKIGGIPVPSIGITKVDSPFGGFGGITLIAPKGMIDPEAGVPVYDRDAWTARFPEMNFKKVKSKLADAFYERLLPMRDLPGGDGGFIAQVWEAIKNANVQNPNQLMGLFKRYEAARALYAQEVLGKTIKAPTRDYKPATPISSDKELRNFYKKNADAIENRDGIPLEVADAAFKEFSRIANVAVDRVAAEAEDRADIKAKLIRESLFDSEGQLTGNYARAIFKDIPRIGTKVLDAEGMHAAIDKVVKRDDPAYLKWAESLVQPLFETPTITVRGREVEPTLDNIVQAMTVGATAGAEKSMTFSAGKVAAMLGKKFKSLDEIKAARDQIVTAQSESDGKKATDALLDEYRTHVSQFYTGKDWRGNVDTWAANDASMEALVKASKRANNAVSIRSALSGMQFKSVDARSIELASQAINALRNASTDYFEAKPPRAVKLNEFRGAVVPKGTSPEAIAALEKNGMAVEVHGKAEGAREKAILKLAARLDKERGDIRFSRTAERQISDARLVATDQLVDELKKNWVRAPEIIVAHNMQDGQIPQRVRDYDAQLKSQGSDGEARGFIYLGKVYLLSDQLRTPEHIAEVLFHEVLGHYGLRGVFGDKLNPILNEVGMLRRPQVVAKAKEYGLVGDGLDLATATNKQVWDSMSPKQRLSAAEEVLAEMAQTTPSVGHVQRAIAAIRTWLRENIPSLKSMKLTDAEIIRSFIVPAREYVTRQNETVEQAVDRAMEAAFSFAGENGKEMHNAPMPENSQNTAPSYQGSHSAPSASYGAPAHNLVPSFPEDVYSKQAESLYGDGNPSDKQALSVIRSIRNQPDAEVTIYRAIPKGETSLIRSGDWVSLTRTYAEQHGDAIYDGDYQVVSQKVRASEIYNDGNSIHEWGYRPAGESTVPDSGDTPVFARGHTTGPGLFQPTIWNTPEPTRTDRIIHKLQDGRVDLKRVQEAIKESGQAIEEKFDARLAETLYPGRVAYRSQQFLASEVHPLLQSMALNKVTMNELADYLHARGAEERNIQIAKVNPAMPDGGAGTNTQGTLLTTQAARDYLSNIPANRLAALEATARKVDAITSGTRQLMVSEGLEKQETIDAWQAAYKNYVPMFRDEADGMPPHPQGAGFTVKGSASKRATGSTKEVTNILAHVLMQREAAITRAEKNRVALSLYGLALSSPNPKFWTTIKPGMSNAQIGAELVAMGVDPMTAQIGMEGVPTIRTVDPVTNKVIDRANPMYKSLPGAITMKLAGEDRVLMINTKNERGLRMAENLKNLDGLTNLDLAGSIIGKSTRWIASVNTQYNPAFGVVNLVRDTLGGAIHLSNTELRGKSMEVLGHVPAAMTGIARELAKPGQTGQWQKLYREFQEDGGQTGFKENFRDPNHRAKAIEKELASLGKSKLSPGKAAHAVLDLLDGFNTSMENAVRLSSYKTALDQGISRAEAARLARELTVDFNRKGVAGREMGPLYAFFNASVQGNARTWQAIKGPGGRKIVLGGLSLGMLQALMLLAAGYDDDEIPEFVKTRALIIPLFGKEKKFVSIPYPLGLHVLPNTGRVMAELMLNGGKDIGKRSFDAVGEIAGAMNPLGGGNVFTADGALKTLAPTVIDPFIELTANKNFSGNQIERKPFNEEGDNRPGYARARESTQRSTTGQVYLGISKAINKLTGGSAYEAGLASPTAERVRYLGQVVGGGVLREMEKTIDGSVKAANGEAVKPSAIPMFSRFYGEVDKDSVEMSRYYEARHKMDKAQSSLKAAEKAGDMKAYTKLLRENPGVVAYGDLQKVQKSISELNKLAIETVENPAKMKKIDTLRTEQMSVMNKLLKKMEKGEPTLADRLRPGEAATP